MFCDQPAPREIDLILADVLAITITVPGRPTRAGIDPRHLLIDAETGDDVVDVGGR